MHRESAISLLGQMSPGRMLDIPAGKGKESLALRALGYQALAVDLFPSDARDRTLPWVRADANRVLPFRSCAFNYVLSREGIEHLEDQLGFVRECARVLKPGGSIVLTTPNTINLSSRVSHFLTVQRKLSRGLVNEVQTLRATTGEHYYHGHIFLIDYFRLRYLLKVSGFDRIEIHTDRYSPTSVALSWLVPALYLASKWAVMRSTRRARRKQAPPPPAAVISEIFRHVFSPALLFGKRLIVIAEKPAAG